MTDNKSRSPSILANGKSERKRSIKKTVTFDTDIPDEVSSYFYIFRTTFLLKQPLK
jgi:hypothetical protein